MTHCASSRRRSSGAPRRALALALSLATSGVGAGLGAPSLAVAAAIQPEKTAEELYYEGSARFSSADYDGAIASFQQALEVATLQGADASVRGALLLNLAKARLKAFDIDGDLRQAKQAKEIYERYVREAEDLQYPADDVKLAQDEAARVGELIAAREAEAARTPAPAGGSAPDPRAADEPVDSPSGPNRRTRGIALTAAGSALFAGGIGLLIYGARLGPLAEDDVDAARSDPNFDQAVADQFIEDEQAKGRIWIGVGAGVAVVGVAGIVVGALDLARSKSPARARLQWAPVAHADGWGLALRGRF